MRSSSTVALLWSYWANLVYIIGMLGYLTIDTISYRYTSFNNTLSLVIYLSLAVLFVIDALLYTIDWYIYAVKLRKPPEKGIQYRSEFVACVFQNLGSCFYLIGAILAFDRTRLIDKILLFNLIGVLSFLTESIFTLLGWFIVFRRRSSNEPKIGCSIQNVYIWAHAFNIGGNVIYLCAAILAYDWYRNYKMINSSTVLLIQIIGDWIYLFDAYLYHDCWLRDAEEFKSHVEPQSPNQSSSENVAPDKKSPEKK